MADTPVLYLPHGTWAICDRCGFKRRLSALAKEWTNLMVCRDTCFDPRPAEMTPPVVWAEGLPVPNARPEPPDTFITTPVLASDL